jgi:hypothetical protein
MSPPALSVTHSASRMGSIAALSTPSRRYPTTLQTQRNKQTKRRGRDMEEHVRVNNEDRMGQKKGQSDDKS